MQESPQKVHHPSNKKEKRGKRDKSPRLPYTASENSLEMYAALQRQQRSNSCEYIANTNSQIHFKEEIHETSLLDPSLFETYEKLKYFYAEMLYVWGLNLQRLCVLKVAFINQVDMKNVYPGRSERSEQSPFSLVACPVQFVKNGQKCCCGKQSELLKMVDKNRERSEQKIE